MFASVFPVIVSQIYCGISQLMKLIIKGKAVKLDHKDVEIAQKLVNEKLPFLYMYLPKLQRNLSLFLITPVLVTYLNSKLNLLDIGSVLDIAVLK